MKQRKRKKRLNPDTVQLIRRIFGGVLALALLAGLIWTIRYVTNLPALTIQEVNVSGGETIPHQLIEAIVQAELEGEYVRLIPKRFTFTYPKQSITSAIAEVDRVKDMIVERTLLNTLAINFTEYVPDSLWCNEGSGECVFLDENGFAFAEAPTLDGGSFLRLGKLGVEPVTDIQAFDPTNYMKVKYLVSLLEAEAWFVESVGVDVANDAYLELTEGGELKVALADSAEQIVENLFTVLTSAEFTEIEPGNFEYIDLRFGDKVFVNELEPETDLELASSTESELE